MQIEQRVLKPSQLLLDPNNYRFLDLPGFKHVIRSRYAEAGVQSRALQYLQDTPSFELEALRASIISNGFVPFEQIVVEAYASEANPPLYLVIEGNRRAAAIKTLLSDHAGGSITLPPYVLESIQSLPVVEVTGSDQDRHHYQQTLMAIRHVAGIREWGPYQQAKLIVEMFEGDLGSFGAVAQRIGISSQAAARRYRASKALQQMEEDDEFGEFADPRLYVFFHEAVSQPKVRQWLGFSDNSYRAENEEARRTFYELLSPREVEGERLPAKLQNANRQVRLLKDIVDKPVPLKILADPERPFEDAVEAAQAETTVDEAGVLEHAVGTALHALKQPSIDTWLAPTERAKVIWIELVGMVDKIKPLMSER